MRIFGKKIEYRRWNFGVEWVQDGKWDIRHFATEEEANEFFQKKRANMCRPNLFRFRPETWLDQWLGATFVWDTFQLRIWPLCAVLILAAFIFALCFRG